MGWKVSEEVRERTSNNNDLREIVQRMDQTAAQSKRTWIGLDRIWGAGGLSVRVASVVAWLCRSCVLWCVSFGTRA